MAYACPSCETPASVAILFGEEGSFPFPCARCAWLPRWMPAGQEQRANAPCPTRGCDGSVCEVYVYRQQRRAGELSHVRRERCRRCADGAPAYPASWIATAATMAGADGR